ncbi:PilZ domain-containing protein [Altererythrobacter sp. SALINAS58]|uniref:PilZ domain-containing protein n=1 Tax=Alteripontixanthobacter muriae TaxID=2705546 RepID=UPI0015762736|nr:PilZ domain-containing protein [Alteripontixanthobacter muriae]
MRITAVLGPSPDSDHTFSDLGVVSERRSSERRLLTLSAVASASSAEDLRVVVRDISPEGFLLEVVQPGLALEDGLEVELPELGLVAARVIWTSGCLFGCKFNNVITESAISAALLKAEPISSGRSSSDGALQQREEIRSRLTPQLNLSAALSLTILLWIMIGSLTYSYTN